MPPLPTTAVKNLLLAAAGLLLAMPACADGPLPESFSTSYSVRLNGLRIGETVRRLQRVGGNLFRFESITRPTGVAAWFRDDHVSEESTWSLSGADIRPMHYTYDRKGNDKENHVEIRFDWPNRTIYNTAEGHTWSMELPGNVLDKLLYQIAMMRDLKTPGRELHYAVADGGVVKDYRFRVGGEEFVDTPLGRLKSLKIERLRDDDKRTTVLWCASEFDYLPVRIEHTKKGSHRTTLLLESYSGLQ